MISYRGRDGKRGKNFRMPKTMERLFKESKCRDCSVVVTRMDFARILGKFTKVKIQYESSSTPKVQKTQQTNKSGTQVANTRLRNNENGMVQFHRKSYNPHPAKDLVNTKKKPNKITSPARQTNSNILKEINVSKNKVTVNNRNYNHFHSKNKQYYIIFNDPTSKHCTNIISEISLTELLPKVNIGTLPSEEWCIDYFPKSEEPKNDKVYDRIAAELEDLMYNEKPQVQMIKVESVENKVDDFPSIMDILNDNTATENNSESKDLNSNLDFKDNLESNDVEAMLLGKTNNVKIEMSMDVENTDVNKLIAGVVQFSADSETPKDLQDTTEIDNPHSPSILDEALKKGIEEHLPNPHLQINKAENQNIDDVTPKDCIQNNLIPSSLKLEDVTHVVFKNVVDGKCKKSVTCPRNLKFSIELEEKSVELLGAPKFISSLEDLQVLLQIVNETDLRSLHVLY